MQIGRVEGCAALVAMLPSKAGLGNTYVSFQMAVDHEAAVANATLALANLAVALGNQVTPTTALANQCQSTAFCLSKSLMLDQQ